MRKNLEIPSGKRTPLYRFFEMLPGLISYTAIILLFVLSWISPILGACYLFIIIAATLVKAVSVAFRTIQGYEVVKKAGKVDWRGRMKDLEDPHAAFERLRGKSSKSYNFNIHVENLRMLNAMQSEYPKPEKIYHAVIMTAYNEGPEILEPSIKAIQNSTFPNERIIFVMAYEERGGEEIEKTVNMLAEKFKGVFKEFMLVKHPKDMAGEVIGKGPNLTYAGSFLTDKVQKLKIPIENVIVTSLDSDNRMAPKYLDAVAYEFVVHPNRQRLSYQPVSLFMNNIWDAPAPTRVVAVSNSFFNIISTMRPHAIRNFASHSQPLQALKAMDYWSKRTIVEDGHQFWRSLFFFDGDYSVLPIRLPIYQDAVMDETLWKTMKAQFVQVRRWNYGASDVAYVGVRLFRSRSKRGMPFFPLLAKFWRLLDGHVTLAIMAPMVAFGGWIPLIMNNTSRDMVVYNLPSVVSMVQTIASIGLLITVLVSLKMLPRRPERYRKGRTILMVLQWILMPVTSILYQSLSAFYAQTRLLLGKYMEKFDVTKKVIKR
ncbi:glycosyltransferase family 2 protein [Candidatus Saccharibacteria bacterium]|nr:glycosyltransferase family 2 protein [Candidatus Saccharibacteria bacterium]